MGVIPERAGRSGDSQPMPVPNAHPDVQSAVIADIQARREVGIRRYGTALQPHNGRDALLDLYEELLDAAMYVKQRLIEQATDPDTDDPYRIRAHAQAHYEQTGHLTAVQHADEVVVAAWCTACPTGWPLPPVDARTADCPECGQPTQVGADGRFASHVNPVEDGRCTGSWSPAWPHYPPRDS